MKKVENKIMLITYANTMGENLKALDRVLKRHFSGVFGGVHVLPFFPSSGDRGFAMCKVEESLHSTGHGAGEYPGRGNLPERATETYRPVRGKGEMVV